MSKFLIVDSNSLASRSYFVPFADEFYKMVQTVVDEIVATHIVFCFDSNKSWRKELYPEYKAKRKPDEKRNLYVNRIKQSLDASGFQTFTLAGYEADDLCASFVAQSPALETYVLSGDKDLLQLICDHDNVKVINIRQNFNARKIFDESLFFDEFGFFPEDYITYKALVGDSSDNIKGVNGIAKVNGTKLVQEFCTLEELYNCVGDVKEIFSNNIYQKLIKGKESAELAYKLVKLQAEPVMFDYEECVVKDLEVSKRWLIQCLRNSN